LESKLTEEDDLNHKNLSVFKSSPETFTKEFLQSYKYKNHSSELISDLDDDDEQMDKDKYQSDVLSTSTISTNQNESLFIDEVNQEKISSTSNYPTKIDTRK
jgi:hypothetical protein